MWYNILRTLLFLIPAFAVFFAYDALATCQYCDYYVATNGNDHNDGKSQASPIVTLTHGVSLLHPGDTLCVMSGTYQEALMSNIPGGLPAAPVTLQAYPEGATVIIKPPLTSPKPPSVLYFDHRSQQYIIVKGFVIDATNVARDAVKITYSGTSTDNSANNITLENVEIKNANQNGVITTGKANNNIFEGLKVHDNGKYCVTDGVVSPRFCHGFYITTSDNLIKGVESYNNTGYGIHIYNGSPGSTANNNIVWRSNIHNNTSNGGIILSSGTGNAAYDNIIWGNHNGIVVSDGAIGTRVFNNTIVMNKGLGMFIGDTQGSKMVPGSTGATIENNILYKNAWGDFKDLGSINSTIDHNLENINPLFVNETGGNFLLSSSSPAIHMGSTPQALPQEGFPYDYHPYLAIDYMGIPRPSGTAYTIGALEYVPQPSGSGNSSEGAVP